jgi:hypothetical protein
VSGDNDPKINVDIGLGAKASFQAQVSTEIPAQSTGRLLDAFTDMIRPFSERRGLKADQIRLQREEVLIEIARKARRRLEIENQEINPLPNKFLVPLLEKASLEEVDSVMIDRWADLLASSSFDPSSAHPRYVQILSELSADEAQLLRRIALNNIEPILTNIKIEQSSMVFRPETLINMLKHLKIQNSKETARRVANIYQKSLLSVLTRPGISLVSIRMEALQGDNEIVSLFNNKNLKDAPGATAKGRILEILCSLYLLKRYDIDFDDKRFISITVSYVCLTALGVEFIIKCDRDVDKAVSDCERAVVTAIVRGDDGQEIAAND